MYIIFLHNMLHLVVWKDLIELSTQLFTLTNNTLERSESEIPNPLFIVGLTPSTTVWLKDSHLTSWAKQRVFSMNLKLGARQSDRRLKDHLKDGEEDNWRMER